MLLLTRRRGGDTHKDVVHYESLQCDCTRRYALLVAGKAQAAIAFEQLLADNMRRLREAKGWQQETLAQKACAEAGLAWTRDTVLRIEQGRRKLTPSELVAICYVLRAALQDLLQGSGDVRLAPGLSLAVRDLPQLLEGKEPASLQTAEETQLDAWLSGGKPVQDLADQRAAKAIGVEVLLIQLLAAKLWGRSLTEERNRRAEGSTNRMKRAHVTRELYTELSAAIAKSR